MASKFALPCITSSKQKDLIELPVIFCADVVLAWFLGDEYPHDGLSVRNDDGNQVRQMNPAHSTSKTCQRI